MNATQTFLADDLIAAHAVLMQDLGDLKQIARNAARGGAALSCDRLTAVREHLARHFRCEEKNGYLTEAVKKRQPNIDREVAQLRADHQRLLASLADLIKESKTEAARAQGWPAKIEGWIDAVEAHEKRENE